MATRPIYFFDFSKKGDLQGNKDLTKITNEQAVMESVYNILLTQPGERVMNAAFGCNIDRYLFEPIADYTAEFMRSEIHTALINYEPRINELLVEVIPDEDNNTYIININFTVNTTTEVQRLQTTLKKIR